MIGYSVDETMAELSGLIGKILSMRHFGEDSVENP